MGQNFFRNRKIVFFSFYTEIQDGRQKGMKMILSSYDSVHTLWVKHFVEITLSHTISEINAFLHFAQKFKMAAKNGGKTIFGKRLQWTLLIARGSKILSKSLYRTPFHKHVFIFYAEIQYGHQKWWENHFWQKVPDKSIHTL